MDEQGVFISTVPASRGDRRLALAVALISLMAFAATVPLARVRLAPIAAFMPFYDAVLLINDLVTVALLLAEYSILRSRALLVLACGYLFTAGMVVPHALTFPGLLSPTGLLGAGPQTTAWLYMFWHAGFPLAVIAYALLQDRTRTAVPAREGAHAVVLGSIAMVLAFAGALTALATAGQGLLPDIMQGSGYTPAMTLVVAAVWVLSPTALAVLWRHKPHSVLDLWLMVVMCAWLCDVALSAVFNAGRFDVGFYAGRIYGLLASTFVLAVLLLRTTALYARIARLLVVEQQERKREAEEGRRIFETSLDLILVTDRHANLLRVSPSAMAVLGYAPSEMAGRNAAEFVHPDDLAAIQGEMRSTRRGHRMRNFETRYRHKEGHLVTLAWSGVWSEPEQRHFLIGRDVTKQKLTERIKDEFVATVSHELRTPLTSIAGALGLLAGGAVGPLPERAARLVDIAQSNGRRLVRLVNDILDINKIEAVAAPFDMRQVDAKALVMHAIEANRSFAESLNVRVRLTPEPADAAVRADPDRLTQVLVNLLSNAAKFSPPGEEVLVSIETLDDAVRIAVRDRGPGIPEAFRGRIFEKFVQVDATDARRRGGTGLGLSIVKQIMLRLGGAAGFEAAPGGGTIFHVDVPRWDMGGTADVDPADAAAA
jgi:PAS domain S-box-containing protein